MTIYKKLLITLATILVISTVPVACRNPDVPVPAELEPRVLGRWDALIDRNFETAYEYFSPAYRKLFPVEHYLSQTGPSVRWLSINIKDTRFTDKRANVKLVLEFQLDLPMGEGDSFGTVSRTVDEVWLWVDGEWWYTSDEVDSLF